MLSDVDPESPKLKTLHPVSAINFAENVWLLPKNECPQSEIFGLSTPVKNITPSPS
jgi:hypothetical protein